ncbi:hypothetical protein MPTK1_4g11350 [Marchantia polymorpha subsp. ruderalis]|uniref:Uncharacterized protein n=1 Tax=Marchantia polymorpha subsp. ruderalis TaxID=1480154 RepID=A0AAF6B8S3_MARPO|nr:hypothetical protein Mp_4g11350 [Marchantia polymorpha subsp. ruderalis]
MDGKQDRQCSWLCDIFCFSPGSRDMRWGDRGIIRLGRSCRASSVISRLPCPCGPWSPYSLEIRPDSTKHANSSHAQPMDNPR